jgi:uncharacterized protein (DUF2141 family)
MKTFITIVILATLVLIKPLYMLQHQKHNLKIRVEGIKLISGNMDIAIYNKSENFPKKGLEYITKSIPVSGHYLFSEFNLPEGTYAVAIYHDANSNGKCDKNLFGIPIEGFGFSNNYKPKFASPSFNSCKFLLDNDKNITVKLIFF